MMTFCVRMNYLSVCMTMWSYLKLLVHCSMYFVVIADFKFISFLTLKTLLIKYSIDINLNRSTIPDQNVRSDDALMLYIKSHDLIHKIWSIWISSDKKQKGSWAVAKRSWSEWVKFSIVSAVTLKKHISAICVCNSEWPSINPT